MDLRSLTAKAKELIDRRGGTGSLKEDAGELKDIAGGEGSLTDKAKAAAEALKEPGADEAPAAHEPDPGAAPEKKTGKGKTGKGRRQGKGRGAGGGGRGGGRNRV